MPPEIVVVQMFLKILIMEEDLKLYMMHSNRIDPENSLLTLSIVIR
jgi:hypothetical protein